MKTKYWIGILAGILAVSLGLSTMVTASVSEYASLKAVAQDRVAILSLEDLILDAAGRD